MTHVLSELDDRVATLTLNSPDAGNAISVKLLAELRDTLRDLDGRANVRAIILTGAGADFCVGMDVAELKRGDSTFAAMAGKQVIPDLGKPLIAAVNGAAFAAGLELALACDFIVAAESAHFADTHAKWGLVPRWGLTVALPEAVGFRRAREMSATGDSISARTALEWGLINHVVPDSELLDYASKLAARISATDAEALEVIYAVYAEGLRLATTDALAVEEFASATWHGNADPESVA